MADISTIQLGDHFRARDKDRIIHLNPNETLETTLQKVMEAASDPNFETLVDALNKYLHDYLPEEELELNRTPFLDALLIAQEKLEDEEFSRLIQAIFDYVEPFFEKEKKPLLGSAEKALAETQMIAERNRLLSTISQRVDALLGEQIEFENRRSELLTVLEQRAEYQKHLPALPEVLDDILIEKGLASIIDSAERADIKDEKRNRARIQIDDFIRRDEGVRSRFELPTVRQIDTSARRGRALPPYVLGEQPIQVRRPQSRPSLRVNLMRPDAISPEERAAREKIHQNILKHRKKFKVALLAIFGIFLTIKGDNKDPIPPTIQEEMREMWETMLNTPPKITDANEENIPTAEPVPEPPKPLIDYFQFDQAVLDQMPPGLQILVTKCPNLNEIPRPRDVAIFPLDKTDEALKKSIAENLGMLKPTRGKMTLTWGAKGQRKPFMVITPKACVQGIKVDLPTGANWTPSAAPAAPASPAPAK